MTREELASLALAALESGARAALSVLRGEQERSTQPVCSPAPEPQALDPIETMRALAGHPSWRWPAGIPAVCATSSGLMHARAHEGWPIGGDVALPDAAHPDTARALCALLIAAEGPEDAARIIGAALIDAWSKA